MSENPPLYYINYNVTDERVILNKIDRSQNGVNTSIYSNTNNAELTDGDVKKLVNFYNQFQNEPQNSNAKFYDTSNPDNVDKPEITKERFGSLVKSFISGHLMKNIDAQKTNEIEDLAEKNHDATLMHGFIRKAIEGGLTDREIEGLKMMDKVLGQTKTGDINSWDKLQQDNYKKALEFIEGPNDPARSK